MLDSMNKLLMPNGIDNLTQNGYKEQVDDGIDVPVQNGPNEQMIDGLTNSI